MTKVNWPGYFNIHLKYTVLTVAIDLIQNEDSGIILFKNPNNLTKVIFFCEKYHQKIQQKLTKNLQEDVLFKNLRK